MSMAESLTVKLQRRRRRWQLGTVRSAGNSSVATVGVAEVYWLWTEEEDERKWNFLIFIPSQLLSCSVM
ncbi:hypothetical protein NL676_004149 [Syzygium grande]|nr:hypothetical protein NL676_004149 [Syzygium grande]